ncbi:MAG: general secretion pathway protein GspK [Candidatus Manganitrophus sp.]|nr:general secretion pathway protein GspK [Candidatus Manganitrophus sp.]
MSSPVVARRSFSTGAIPAVSVVTLKTTPDFPSPQPVARKNRVSKKTEIKTFFMGGSIPEAMHRHNKLLKNEGGFALLLSLLVVLLLTVLILEIDFQARADLRAAGNFRDDLKAFYLARSAVSAGEAILKEDLRFSNKYDGLDELWAYPVPDYPLGDGVLSGAITDETGKFNLNSLVDNNGKTAATVQKTRHKQLRRLFELLQLDPELVDPIVDWADIDSEPISAYGAEDETYRRLDPPLLRQKCPLRYVGGASYGLGDHR